MSTDFLSPSNTAASSQASAAFHSGNSVQDSSATITPAMRKLRAAAGEFESLLLSNLWKSMKSTFASSDDESSDPGHDTLEEMGIQAMSSAVGKAGGLGLGKLILKHLEPKLEHSNHASGPASANAFPAPADIPP